MDWFIASFRATIMLGIVAMLGLLVAGIVCNDRTTVVWSVAAMGMAYAAQWLTSISISEDDDAPKAASYFALVSNLGAAAAWLAGFLQLT